VEAAVLIVQRWILARLRNRRFFSLAELNVAIRILVDELNARLMRKLGASGREFFDTIDLPALMPLPAEPYQYAEWRRARVAPDYHVEVQGHFYSVPSRMIRQVVEVRATEATIEVFHRGTRVASHDRDRQRHVLTPQLAMHRSPVRFDLPAMAPPGAGASFRAGEQPGLQLRVGDVVRQRPAQPSLEPADR
jgi:transposase